MTGATNPWNAAMVTRRVWRPGILDAVSAVADGIA
jgi:hypothetical protein